MTNHTNHEKRMRIMLFNLILVFVVTTLIAFCIDGFLLHPIPSQGYGETFSLRETDTVMQMPQFLRHTMWAGPNMISLWWSTMMSFICCTFPAIP